MKDTHVKIDALSKPSAAYLTNLGYEQKQEHPWTWFHPDYDDYPKYNKYFNVVVGKVSTAIVSDADTNKYDRVIAGKQCGGLFDVDVYDVLKAFNVQCPALQHLIKKALCAGLRGHKNKEQDLQDIVDSALRAQELGAN